MQRKVEELKRGLILDEAALFFLRESFDKVQIAEIAKRSGVSVGTIYNLFGSKEGLYEAFVDRQIAAAYESMRAACDICADPVDKLKTIIGYKFNHFEENREVIRANILSNPLFFHKSSCASSPAMTRIMELMQEIIATIIDNPTIDTLQMAYHFKAMGNSYIERWMDSDFDLRTKTDEMVALFLYGVTSLKGARA